MIYKNQSNKSLKVCRKLHADIEKILVKIFEESEKNKLSPSETTSVLSWFVSTCAISSAQSISSSVSPKAPWYDFFLLILNGALKTAFSTCEKDGENP